MADDKGDSVEQRGAPPAARGGAGVYIEGELGAFYLLAMLAGGEARGMPGARIERIRFQAVDDGYSLDDLVIEGSGPLGPCVLEIQSKRTISFSPKDAVFREVCDQIKRSQSLTVAEDRHLLAVATQRNSRKISGPYQDVLAWARSATSADAFFTRMAAKGVPNPSMREFVETFRTNLAEAGTEDLEEIIWRLLRRFQILEFDFEATGSLARTYGVNLARQVLAPEDIPRADALWRTLIETAIGTGKTGGSLDLQALRDILVSAGFRLAGERDYAPARARLAEVSRLTLDGIGRSVGKVRLPRLLALEAADEALETHRFIELRGGPGVGKSGVLSLLAERQSAHSPVIVLDQVATPKGGWLGFAGAYAIPGTAREFLNDLAASGGATIFVDGLDMISDPERQRTISELLRTASDIEGFLVVATSRDTPPTEADQWLDDAIISAFGGIHPIRVGELGDDEVAILIEADPQLKVLLDPDHPAAPLARNLYRLSRLLKVPGSTTIRTEASLARYWWDTADGAPQAHIRQGQRLLSSLAELALSGGGPIHLPEDSAARSHLLHSKAMREVRRDCVDFYHDILRDWAIGNLIAEDPVRLSDLDLTIAIPPRVARGIEIAGRIVLESSGDGVKWAQLLSALSPPGAHSSWRRQAMLAIVRSEVGPELLDRSTGELLTAGAALFNELCATILAVETVATAELMKEIFGADAPVPSIKHRTNNTASAVWVLQWVLDKADLIPLQAIGSVLSLVEIQFQLFRLAPSFGKPTASLLFGWLLQLDLRDTALMIPRDASADFLDDDARRRLVERLRNNTLLLSSLAPDQLKAYLNALIHEGDRYKIKEIRHFSSVIAPVAPAELTQLIISSLIAEPFSRTGHVGSRDKAFGFADSDYLPASPAQPPFHDLLDASPEHGLELVRRLVAEAATFWASDDDGDERPDPDGIEIALESGPRFFPVERSYFWSRDQSSEYAAASALKALEAWGHARLDAGDDVEAVITDVLGPEGSCAAFLLVATDLLLSHWPKTREALVPFLACPKLLAYDRRRQSHDQTGVGNSLFEDREPRGTVKLADLQVKPSRRISLECALPQFLGNDRASEQLRELLGAAVDKLEPYASYSDFADERFLGRYALNLLTIDNWKANEDGNLAYQPPADEAAHIAQLNEKRAAFRDATEIQARIDLACEGGEYATSETARIAVDFANAELPDEEEGDALKLRSTRLITTALLVARDGDDALLAEHEAWVRSAVATALCLPRDRLSGRKDLRYNRPAIAVLALVHLWLRQGLVSDRDALIIHAARKDCCAVPALKKASSQILQAEPRLFKAAMRAAFSSFVWRWHSYDEDPEVQKRFEEEQAAVETTAVAAAIAWLDGGQEASWPQFPTGERILRKGIRLQRSSAIFNTESTTESGGEESSDDENDGLSLHIDSHAAALWLGLLNLEPLANLDWTDEVVEAYSHWTALANGLGLPRGAEIDRMPSEWNNQFYILVAQALFRSPDAIFKTEIERVTALPDKSFGEVAQALLHAADVIYFNEPSRSAVRAVELRERLRERIFDLRHWKRFEPAAQLRVDHDTGGIAAKMLFNTHDPFNRTRSYLVAAVFDRIDPLLPVITPLLGSGPTAFVALCVMNTLEVAPRARHVSFLLDGAQAWFSLYPTDKALWIELGIGHRIVNWLRSAGIGEPSLLRRSHAEHGRIRAMLSQLVALGVPEAYELEMAIELAEEEAATLPSSQNG